MKYKSSSEWEGDKRKLTQKSLFDVVAGVYKAGGGDKHISLHFFVVFHSFFYRALGQNYISPQK